MSETALMPMTGPRGVALRDTGDIERFATLVYKSTLVPSEYRHKLADVFGVIAYGLELGLNPMQSLQNIAWVNSKPSVYGDMLLGLVEASGLLEEFEEVEPDEAFRTGAGRCTLKRRGRQPITRVFTQTMAETAKLWGKNTWATYPGRMLQMRARSWALRDAFSDVLKGLYAREEAEDIVLTADAKGTYQADDARPARQESISPRDALPEQMEPTGMEHPTAEQVNSLIELIRVNGLDVAVEMHVRLGLPPGVVITKKVIRETITMEQYAEAWLFYSHELKEDREVVDDEDDVPTYSPPDGADVPQDERSPETHSSGHEKTALTHESARPLYDEIGPEGVDGISDTSPTTIEMDDGFPTVEVDDEGFVTPPGIELLVKRAQSFNAMAMLRKLRADEPRLTIGRYRYCWEQVGKK